MIFAIFLNNGVWKGFCDEKNLLIQITFFAIKLPYVIESWRLPTNDISIELEIWPKFGLLWFKMYSTDHNEILHMSWECSYNDVCKI